MLGALPSWPEGPTPGESSAAPSGRAAGQDRVEVDGRADRNDQSHQEEGDDRRHPEGERGSSGTMRSDAQRVGRSPAIRRNPAAKMLTPMSPAWAIKASRGDDRDGMSLAAIMHQGWRV